MNFKFELQEQYLCPYLTREHSNQVRYCGWVCNIRIVPYTKNLFYGGLKYGFKQWNKQEALGDNYHKKWNELIDS